jgi:hypothetical protein
VNQDHAGYEAKEENKPNHASLSWIACYDDTYLIHKSDKDARGWYPKEPKKQRKLAVLERTVIEEDEGDYLVTNSMGTSEAEEWERQAVKLLREMETDKD